MAQQQQQSKCPAGEKTLAGHFRLSTDFIGLYTSGANSDVTFVFPDGEIRAHKMILTTRVPYFEKMFASGMKEALTNRVDITDADKKDFDVFLRYIYGGQLPDNLEMPTDVESQLNFAEKYDMPALVTDCLQKFGQYVSNLPNFGACVNEAAKILVKCKVEMIKTTLEEELVKRFDRELPASYRPQIGKYYRHNSPKAVDHLFKLLIISRSHGLSTLKEKCLECLVHWGGLGDFETAVKKLKGYPDLLIEMVTRYHRNSFPKDSY